MSRYIRLYLCFIRFSIGRSLEFRLDFFFRIFMDSFYYIMQLVFYKVVFLNTTSLGGWREDQILVFVAACLMVDALQMTLFSNNIWVFPALVNKGELDYYLVRPVSSMFFISTRDFATNSFINFLMTIGICIWALGKYQGDLTVLSVGLYFLCIFIGSILHYSLHFMFMLPVFWTHSGKGMVQLYWPLTKFMERPDSIYFGWTRGILLSILPFSIMASFPARVIWDSNPLEISAIVLGTTLVFLFVASRIWEFGLKSYSSASS